MKKIIGKIWMLGNWVVIALLLLCILTPTINPEKFSFFSILGLSYPILIFLNIAFIFIWMLFKKLRFLYSTLAIFAVFAVHGSLIQFNSEVSKGDIKVISFNCKLMGLYDDNVFVEDFINYVNKTDADVICIQEFYNYLNNGEQILEYLKGKLNYKYIHFQAKVEGNPQRQLGALLISKHPILATGLIPFETVTSNICLYADIDLKGRRTRVYNAHLQSIKISRKERAVFDNMEQDIVMEHSKSVLRRMKRAFTIRVEQANAIKDHMNQTSLPTILCGDFNDTPISYCYKIIAENMNSCFDEKGFGVESTYLGQIPLLHIDYILHSQGFETTKYSSSKNFPSDHKVIVAELNAI